MLDELLKSLTESELRFIAGQDYGIDTETHLAALKVVIAEQGGVIDATQYWFPYEVIELCARVLTPGHEREFAACTWLVIRAVAAGVDKSTTLGDKFDDRRSDYDALPPPLRDAILDAYQQRAGT